MESANVKELMDKIGVKTQVVKQGTYKEAGTPTREWTAQERAELETLTKDTYELFVHDVAAARGLDENASSAYADAHIFSSQRAKKAGLIDEIGIKNQAKTQLAKAAHVTKPVWREKDKFEAFLERLERQSILKVQSYFYGLKASL
jgi:protease-4